MANADNSHQSPSLPGMNRVPPMTYPLVLDLHRALFCHLVQMFDLFIRQSLQIRILIDLTGWSGLSLNGFIDLHGIVLRSSGGCSDLVGHGCCHVRPG